MARSAKKLIWLPFTTTFKVVAFAAESAVSSAVTPDACHCWPDGACGSVSTSRLASGRKQWSLTAATFG